MGPEHAKNKSRYLTVYILFLKMKEKKIVFYKCDKIWWYLFSIDSV